MITAVCESMEISGTTLCPSHSKHLAFVLGDHSRSIALQSLHQHASPLHIPLPPAHTPPICTHPSHTFTQSKPKPQLPHENLLINELIRDYLEFNGYKYTCSVLLAGMAVRPGSRCSVASFPGQWSGNETKFYGNADYDVILRLIGMC